MNTGIEDTLTGATRINGKQSSDPLDEVFGLPFRSDLLQQFRNTRCLNDLLVDCWNQLEFIYHLASCSFSKDTFRGTSLTVCHSLRSHSEFHLGSKNKRSRP